MLGLPRRDRNNILLYGCCALCVLVVSACSGTALFRQYEYEEEIYLSLDGTATVYVNSSIAALNALRGTTFDASPEARVDTTAVRAYYATPATRVVRVNQSRRNNRRFVHVRLDVDDITRLGDVAPFAWSKYQFTSDGDLFKYRQFVGPAAGKDPGNTGWNGGEIVAFRLHLPSKIRYHNTKRDVGRGNILVWEQSLAERLRSVPIELDARMERQSILYTTLWLFGTTFVAVALAFAVVVVWIVRKGVGEKRDQRT
jgi:hypothetical protein